MVSIVRKYLGPAVLFTLFFALILGIAYPLLVTGVAQVAFPSQANGSIVYDPNGSAVGSELIGQQFTQENYFHGRPSAAGSGYDAMASGGSNLGPSNPALYDRINGTVNASTAAGDTNPDGTLPADAATSSGNGLDPHITIANALDQVHRVAQARNLTDDEVRGLVDHYTEDRDLGVLGEPRVNVLNLNMALDRGEAAQPTTASVMAGGNPQFYGLIQTIAILAAVIIGSYFLGNYLFTILTGKPTRLTKRLAGVEKRLYRLMMVDAETSMDWKTYVVTLLVFSLISFLFTYFILRLQGGLPWNPLDLQGVRPDIAGNTAVSFGSNTNWQTYSGEQTLSYFSQMVALATQNFFSAAVGIAVALVLVRGITKRERGKGLGNFWVDMTRIILYVLLPISIVAALILVSQGVPQTLNGPAHVVTVEGADQVIALGPVASQEAIKELGTNGGGFFNANSAHPFENPSPLTNALEIWLTLVIPGALLLMFGLMARRKKEGVVLFVVVMSFLIAGIAISTYYEQQGNATLTHLGVDQLPSGLQAGGNMEGKEVRFGIYGSTMFDVATTATSCGAVNSMLDSYTPLGGATSMVLILLGEVVPGGVGSGLYTLMIYVMITIFMAGLMIGRIPTYLGKKLETFDMKMAILAIIALETTILVFAAIAAITSDGTSSVLNPGPHGLSEILYGYGSGVGNNGSAFGGLNAATLWWTVTMTVAMFIGRFLVIIPILAIAGSFAMKDVHPVTAGTLPTDNATFGLFLVGVIVIIAGLSFLPVLVLGPILEHLQLFLGGWFP